MIIRSFEDAIRWYLTAYFGNEKTRNTSYKQHEQLLDALEQKDSQLADLIILAIFSEGILGLRNKLKNKSFAGIMPAEDFFYNRGIYVFATTFKRLI
jgi:DNA-binding FadR family transcriptional regulator